MPKAIKGVYWDACSWIALIQDEIVTLRDGSIERRGQMCRTVLEAAKAKKFEIFTSAFSLAEVNKTHSAGEVNTQDKLKDFFENDFIIIVELDRFAGELARDLMQSGFVGLKPPDATHLSSAALSGVDEMHTFDQKLLNLNNQIDRPDGSKLRIIKPELAHTPAPLLELRPAKPEDLHDDSPTEAEEERSAEPEETASPAEQFILTDEEIDEINVQLEAEDEILGEQENTTFTREESEEAADPST